MAFVSVTEYGTRTSTICRECGPLGEFGRDHRAAEDAVRAHRLDCVAEATVAS